MEKTKEKITPESFLAIIIDEPQQDMWMNKAADKCFALHLQSLQQLLDEASEELPDNEKIKDKILAQGSFEAEGDCIEVGQWMRSEAAKIIMKYKSSYQVQWDEIHELNATIKELKEELARKDKDVIGFKEWCDENEQIECAREEKNLPTSYLLQVYQASKTDKP